MIITMQSGNYTPSAVRVRYVRRQATGADYVFCEVGADARYNIRHGVVTAEELPGHIRAAADARNGQLFGYVAWPAEGQA